jgi:hypothetical protein
MPGDWHVRGPVVARRRAYLTEGVASYRLAPALLLAEGIVAMRVVGRRTIA